MSYGTVSPELKLRIADNALAGGGGVNHLRRPTAVASELMSDSRVLIEHARLLVRNSTSRIDRIEKHLQRFVAVIDAAESTNGPAGERLRARILRWLDRRDAA